MGDSGCGGEPKLLSSCQVEIWQGANDPLPDVKLSPLIATKIYITQHNTMQDCSE